MVLSETQQARFAAGLTLIRVLREGLRLAEYLGETICRANGSDETTSRTRRPEL